MKAESIVYTVAGMCFGIILGWVIGTQQAGREGAASPVPTANSSQAAPSAQQPPAPKLDEGRVQALTTILDSDPKNAQATLELANLYFDAERWDDAITWYEKAVTLNPTNADASTDLGVSYYYTNKADQALARFETSLKIDPKHTKTMLNKGIVLAFGKQDLAAAANEWKKVVEIAPDSPEGQAARRALEGVAAAHKGETPSNQ
jgi:tetratricopeptide (TPR) repeat protein